MTDDIAGIELAYNIVDALRRYADHSDCQLFSALLAGQVHPAVWFDRVALVDKLRVSHTKRMECVMVDSCVVLRYIAYVLCLHMVIVVIRVR